MSMTSILVGDIVPYSQRGKYQGYLGGVWGVASVLGPILGGLLTDKASWRCVATSRRFPALACVCLRYSFFNHRWCFFMYAASFWPESSSPPSLTFNIALLAATFPPAPSRSPSSGSPSSFRRTTEVHGRTSNGSLIGSVSACCRADWHALSSALSRLRTTLVRPPFHIELWTFC